MAKAPPITPGVFIGSKENADALIAEATGLRLNLSLSQARGLIRAADGYAQALTRDEHWPRVGKTAEELERIAEQADRLLKTLSNQTLSAIPLLDQAPFWGKDLIFPPRKPLIETLKRARDAARGIARKLPVDKGGDPDPHFSKFIRVAQRIYKEAGGPGRGAWRSKEPGGGHKGRAVELIRATFRLGPGENHIQDKDVGQAFLKVK